jgi:hypothetical protein
MFVCLRQKEKKLLRLYFKFDSLIRHCDIIANIILYIMGVVVIMNKQ